MEENISLLFDMDVREKKRAASGIHKRTGTRGYVGKMLFPNDLMSRKEKRRYKGASKIVSYSYNEILPLDKLRALAIDTQRELIEAWRQKFTSKEMKNAWNMNDHFYYKFLDSIGIERERRQLKERKPKAVAMKTSAPAQLAIPGPPTPEPAPEVTIARPPRPMYDGFRLEMQGEYETPEAINRLMKLCSLIEGEEKKYKITIMLEEKN